MHAPSFRGEARRAEKPESRAPGLWSWIPGSPLLAAPRNDSFHGAMKVHLIRLQANQLKTRIAHV